MTVDELATALADAEDASRSLEGREDLERAAKLAAGVRDQLVALGPGERARQTLERARAVGRALEERGGAVLGRVGELEGAERPAFGKAGNALKRSGAAIAEWAVEALDELELEAARAGSGFDPTLPAAAATRGSLHPVTQVLREVEDIFTSMGYLLLDGPEVELDHYNFEALNFPPDHPAREEYDTFWCDRDGKLCLRTHTSPVQIRAMERMEPPIRAIAPGRVFRHEEQDTTHDHTFHQVEGLVVGEGIAVGHLTGTLKGFLRELLQRELGVRLRPGYFPFVEPGFEFDIACPFCSEDGACRVCKGTRWMEFCGCGMVHPAVLSGCGIDPERYSGFAFGFGLDRLVMLRHGIDDLRHFMGGDLRFLEQF